MSLTPTLGDATPATPSPEVPPAPRRPLRRRLGRPPLLLRRPAGALAVVLSVVTFTFLVTRVFTPDPTNLFLGASGNGFASAEAQAEAAEKVRATLGLDRSIPEQYVGFLHQLVRGDLGESFDTGRPVTHDLLTRLPATAELALYALLVGVTLGVVVGVLSAVYQGGLFDRGTRFLTIGALAVPQFWIGLMLLWIFYTRLQILPGPIGRLPADAVAPRPMTGFIVVDSVLEGMWTTAGQAALQLVLPVITLAIGLAAPIAKVVRTSMIESLASDYVRTALALGFGRRRIWLGYALKNGLLPVLTVLAGVIAFTFAGSVLIEGIFGWPGIGNYSLQAIQHSDFPAIQGFVLYATILYVVIYEALNSLYAIADPRIRS
jgi:ABC-type dipeptide/oligopeptide/nickel transport system permease component